MVKLCQKLIASSRFDLAILCVILLNALVLGAETAPSLKAEYGDTLVLLNDICFAIFVVELLIRITATFPHPRDFFRSGWNIFDLIVIGSVFIPGVRENATLLRLLRLLRITRAVRLLPDVRILLAAIIRSAPGVASLAVLTLLMIYLYGMVGWVLFHEGDPENFGNIGEAMLTMFMMLTLESLPDYVKRGEELSDWAVPFYVSYVILAAFLIFNLFIGIVINSLEEARTAEHKVQRDEERAAAGKTDDPLDDLVVDVEDRIDGLRAALSELEEELGSKVRRAKPD